MPGTDWKRFLKHSIRLRILCYYLLSILVGLTLGWLLEGLISGSRSLPADSPARFGLFMLLSLLFATVALTVFLPLMLRPIADLNRWLRQIKSRSEIGKINPSQFGDLAPLVQTVLDYIEWAENQQTLASAIHHAFRKRIEQLAEYDSLTGLHNRHYLESVLPLQLAHAATVKDKVSLIMLDVDHFKNYNDANGHLEGDRVLKKIADILRGNVRDQDICCRYGGEEFLVVLPSAPLDKALGIAERIRGAVEKAPFDYEHSQPLGRITASLGVATYPDHSSKPKELIECADSAMYAAKRLGRNRVCPFEDRKPAGQAEIRTIEPAT